MTNDVPCGAKDGQERGLPVSRARGGVHFTSQSFPVQGTSAKAACQTRLRKRGDPSGPCTSPLSEFVDPQRLVMSGRPYSGSGAKLSWKHLDMAEGEHERAEEERHEDEPSCLLYSLAMSYTDISTSSSEMSCFNNSSSRYSSSSGPRE